MLEATAVWIRLAATSSSAPGLLVALKSSTRQLEVGH
jgi:hypothetical protein